MTCFAITAITTAIWMQYGFLKNKLLFHISSFYFITCLIVYYTCRSRKNSELTEIRTQDPSFILLAVLALRATPWLLHCSCSFQSFMNQWAIILQLSMVLFIFLQLGRSWFHIRLECVRFFLLSYICYICSSYYYIFNNIISNEMILLNIW